MQALHLDFQRSVPGHRRLGLLLLAAGLVLSGVLLIQYRSIAAEIEDLQRQLVQLNSAAIVSAEAAAGAGRATQSAPVSHSAAQWEAMFAALEAVGDESVTLLGLLPGASEIQISGEAKNLAAMMAYVGRLQSTRPFANVHLTQSEIVAEHAQHPVRFSLAAPWSGELP